MRAFGLAVLGVAAYGAFLAATLPASFAAARLEERAGGSLEVREASGTVWQGRAVANVATPAGPVALQRIEWRWLPARLVSARLAFEVTAGVANAEARGELARGLAAWEVREARLRGDAAAATAILPWLATWRPEGAIEARAGRLRWDGDAFEGDATVEWRNAAVALSTVKPLGDYRAELHGGRPARVSVATLSGPFQVSGQGTWSPEAGLAFAGAARGEGEQARALEPLLDLVGPRRADGSRALEWRMR